MLVIKHRIIEHAKSIKIVVGGVFPLYCALYTLVPPIYVLTFLFCELNVVTAPWNLTAMK